MSENPQDHRRRLPAVDRLLREPALARLEGYYGRDALLAQARAELERLREGLDALEGPAAVAVAVEELPGRIAASLERRFGAGMRRVLNATGVFVHTNLGRSPLPRAVAEELPRLLTAACDLEMDLETGQRGSRTARVETLLAELTGAEAATVTNNNAAALVLALMTLAAGREAVISRGELVEIGGSFRIPEILTASGTRMVEVGTTNRTRLGDYRDALNERTALLVKVYPSNYRIHGFTEEVSADALVGLARERDLPLLVDEGSGLLRDRPEPQLRDHRSLAGLIGLGVDLACGSGDKLLGGPQAGLLVGRREAVERCRRHPLYRALRPDKMTLGALEGVLRLHLSGSALPMDRLWADPEAHRRRLDAVAERIGAEVVAAEAFVGGGSAPADQSREAISSRAERPWPRRCGPANRRWSGTCGTIVSCSTCAPSIPPTTGRSSGPWPRRVHASRVDRIESCLAVASSWSRTRNRSGACSRVPWSARATRSWPRPTRKRASSSSRRRPFTSC
ncbi:MAG: L-seryl-tRNA(Sec) selenium transferase [Thermoanaerobaculia bacterium]